MAGTFAVDTAATFMSAVLISSGPKIAFGQNTQEQNAAGVPKWVAEVAVTFSPTAPNMAPQSELIKVTVTAPQNPGDGLNPGTPVQLEGLRVGISAPENGQNGKIRGGKPWYSATGFRSASPAVPSRPASSDK